MKLFSKKYKAKLRFKQPIWYQYLSIPLFSIFILITYFLLDTTLDKSFSNFTLPQDIYFYLFTLTLIINLLTWYVSPLSFSKVQRTNCILKNIIEQNNFYYTLENTSKIKTSMVIKFYWESENLFLDIYPFGAKYSKNIGELTPIFQTAFNMTVLSIQDDYPDHTTYVLSKITNNYLDSNDNWNY